MTRKLQVGVLDFCRTFDSVSASDAIWDAVELVQRTEEMGYSRYWLAEHHTRDVAHSCPEVLLPVLASCTQRIRVGTAGVLLHLHSPLRLAKAFRLLQVLFPTRLDLGVARGRVDEAVESRLVGEVRRDEYAARAGELLGYLRGTGQVAANPTGIAPPEIWILGSKTTSMRLAAEHGTAFCLALFLGPTPDTEARAIIEEYRRTFKPSADLEEPKWSVALAGTCSETASEAMRAVQEYPAGVTASIVGDPRECKRRFDDMREVLDTEEFVFLDMHKVLPDRAKAYGLLAEALGLVRQDPSPRCGDDLAAGHGQ